MAIEVALIMRRLVCLLGVILLFMPHSLSIAQEWYETVEAKHSDPFEVRYYCLTIILKHPYKVVPGRGMGKYYIRLPKQDYDRIMASPDQTRIQVSKPITAEDVKILRSHLKKRADQGVPVIVDIASFFASHDLVTVGTELISFFDKAFVENSRMAAQELATLIADGGIIQEGAKITEVSPGHPVLGISIVYVVTVGKEKRSYMLASDTYAVKVE